MNINSNSLERLMKINWFCHAGQDLFFGDFVVLKDRASFLKSIGSIEWENATLEARNKMAEYLYENFQREYQNWKPLAKKIREVLENEIVPHMPIEFTLNKVIIDSVKWDIMHYLVECFYKEKLKNKDFLFNSLIDIYERGHIPCGWEGEWPQGKLIIY